MIYYLKYDLQSICKKLVQEKLNTSLLKYNLLNANELDINHIVSDAYLNKLNTELTEVGIEIILSPKVALVQKIKEAIIELVNMEDKTILSKTSYHLAKKLNYGYRYLATVFNEMTYTTIENYIILQKIEKAKEMITTDNFSFSEIAWKLNYSSIGHFSTQFKNTTGLSPSWFKKIILQRRDSQIVEKLIA
jgi:AraC-like DNA-binding protein